jgi:hypothetical protein
MRERLRWDKAQTNFADFCQFVYRGYKPYHHSKIITSELEDFYEGITPRLILTVGPQAGKSTHSSILLPAYIFGRSPDAKILLLSYSASLASEFNREIQKVMDSEEYLLLFPDSALGSANVRTQSDKARRNADVLDIPGHSGMLVNAGIGGGFTGKGFDYIILDDLIKSRDEAESPRYREKLEEAYTDTVKTRRRSDKTRILILNTRWHIEDLTGTRLKKAKENPLADQWKVVNLPALLSACEDIEAERWKFPLGQESGKEVLWPEHFSYEDVIKTKADGLFNFNAQYMGSPVAKEGNAIKRDWYEPFVYQFNPEDVLQIRFAYDVAFTDSPNGDWTWGSLKAKMRDGSFLTLWQDFGHWSNDKRREHIAAVGMRVKIMMYEMFPTVRWALTEEAGVGPGVAVVGEDITYLISKGLPAMAKPIGNLAKTIRAIAYLGACEQKKTKFYAGVQLEKYGFVDGIDKWINPFLNAVTPLLYSDDGLKFIHGHDDMVDAEVQAFDGLTFDYVKSDKFPVLFY